MTDIISGVIICAIFVLMGGYIAHLKMELYLSRTKLTWWIQKTLHLIDKKGDSNE